MKTLTSDYRTDARVVFNRNGTVTVPDEGGNWLFQEEHGQWTVQNTGDGRYLVDEGDSYNRRQKVFSTLDGALFHLIGDPEPARR